MLERRGDQASGLRRLLGQTEGRLTVITVLGATPAAGKTVATVNLASALARAGREVLILDGARRGRGATAALGLTPRAGLAEVLSGRARLESLFLTHEDGVHVLPLDGGLDRLARLDPRDQVHLAAGFAAYGGRADVILIDAEDDPDPDALPLGLATTEILLVVPEGQTALTRAYARMKTLARRYGKHRFHVLFNRVTVAARAQTAGHNLAATAGQYLGVTVDVLGHLPEDAALGQAQRLGSPVGQAFPVASSTSVFRILAERLLDWPSASGLSGVGAFMRQLVEGSRLASAWRR